MLTIFNHFTHQFLYESSILKWMLRKALNSYLCEIRFDIKNFDTNQVNCNTSSIIESQSIVQVVFKLAWKWFYVTGKWMENWTIHHRHIYDVYGVWIFEVVEKKLSIQFHAHLLLCLFSSRCVCDIFSTFFQPMTWFKYWKWWMTSRCNQSWIKKN